MSQTMQRPLPVEIVRQFLGSAPVDLDSMAKALGLEVEHLGFFDEPEVAGKIEREGASYRITINALDPARRQRFTLAHEISHYILHRDLIGDGITDSGLYRSHLSSAVERQANRYAANLLMPGDLVRAAWSAGRGTPFDLSQEFKVSEAAAQIRLAELGMG